MSLQMKTDNRSTAAPLDCIPTLVLSFRDQYRDSSRVRSCIDAVERLSTMPNPGIDSGTEDDNSRRKHHLNNLLNTAVLTLDVLQYQIDSGKMTSARQTSIKAVKALETLNQWIVQSLSN